MSNAPDETGTRTTVASSLAAFQAGHISEAARLLDALPADAALPDYEGRMRRQIEGWRRLLAQAPAVPRLEPTAYEPAPRTALYVTSTCQPFHISGYTVRTQQLLRAAAHTSWRITALARPGYPWDQWDALARADSPSLLHEGVEYCLAPGASLTAMPPDAYITTAAALIESAAREMRPTLIHAASNHLTALPALIAARRLGVPFIYEVRGLWELFAGIGKADWKQSERFLLAKRLETLAAAHADLVFTLTRQLSGELQERGVPAARIRLLPNGGDPGLEQAAAPDRGLLAELGLDPAALTIGYAGALKSYEGLDDLLEAVAQLRRAGRRVQALIVGDGDQLRLLRARASELGLDAAVRFTGRLPPAAAQAHLRASDVAALPRKRMEIAEIVSPLKPFEIMALGIPLVMSNAAALADIAEDAGHAMLLCEASDAQSLAAQIGRLMDDPGLRRDLAARGREFVATRRSWGHVAAAMAAAYDELDGERNTLARTVARRARLALRSLARPFRGPPGPPAEIALIGTSGLFDAGWYLQRYPDAQLSGTSPVEHYLKFGAGEGRDPGPGFDTRWYLEAYPDVARAGINPLVHYLRHGKLEGRSPRRMPG